jgi:SAM-dependent methyltransferase
MLTVDFDRLGVKPKDLMLDAGCGEGRHSFECFARGAMVWSMDMDMDSVRKARYTLVYMLRNNQVPEGGGFLVHLGDALNLPFKDETFNRIICSEVMEHVSDDDQACRELSRVLKKGGTIAITIPTYISELVYDTLTYEYFTSPGGHVRKYFPKKISSIMRKNGLEIYNIGFKHSFHTIYWLIRCVVGLHLDTHPITKLYRSFLTYTMSSGFMERMETFFDNFFPKSLVLYAVKR